MSLLPKIHVYFGPFHSGKTQKLLKLYYAATPSLRMAAKCLFKGQSQEIKSSERCILPHLLITPNTNINFPPNSIVFLDDSHFLTMDQVQDVLISNAKEVHLFGLLHGSKGNAFSSSKILWETADIKVWFQTKCEFCEQVSKWSYHLFDKVTLAPRNHTLCDSCASRKKLKKGSKGLKI